MTEADNKNEILEKIKRRSTALKKVGNTQSAKITDYEKYEKEVYKY